MNLETDLQTYAGCSVNSASPKEITAYENVCHILDAAQEVGLLYQAKDTCGFYQHRSWKKAAPIVNEETTFAHGMGQMLSAGVARPRSGRCSRVDEKRASQEG